MFVTVLKRRNIPSLFVSGCVTLNLTTSITQKLPFDGKTGLVTITNSAPADSSPYILLELSLKHSVQEHSMFLTVFSLSKSFHGKSSLNELAWSAFSVAIDIISLELFLQSQGSLSFCSILFHRSPCRWTRTLLLAASIHHSHSHCLQHQRTRTLVPLTMPPAMWNS